MKFPVIYSVYEYVAVGISQRENAPPSSKQQHQNNVFAKLNFLSTFLVSKEETRVICLVSRC